MPARSKLRRYRTQAVSLVRSDAPTTKSDPATTSTTRPSPEVRSDAPTTKSDPATTSTPKPFARLLASGLRLFLARATALPSNVTSVLLQVLSALDTGQQDTASKDAVLSDIRTSASTLADDERAHIEQALKFALAHSLTTALTTFARPNPAEVRLDELEPANPDYFYSWRTWRLAAVAVLHELADVRSTLEADPKLRTSLAHLDYLVSKT